MNINFGEVVGFSQVNRDKWVSDFASQLPEGTKVLDVGAGECRYRETFSHCEYKTQDFCGYKGTKEGTQKDEWNYGKIDYVSDILSIPVEDNSFDVLICIEVLEHVPEPILVIKELSRILKPGGQLLLSAPLGAGLHQQPHHYYGGFTPNFYKKFMPEFGFEIISIEPNCGFFKHLLQEAWRAYLITKDTKFLELIPYLDKLDKENLIEEFTVGFHIKAKKLGEKE